MGSAFGIFAVDGKATMAYHSDGSPEPFTAQ